MGKRFLRMNSLDLRMKIILGLELYINIRIKGHLKLSHIKLKKNMFQKKKKRKKKKTKRKNLKTLQKLQHLFQSQLPLHLLKCQLLCLCLLLQNLMLFLHQCHQLPLKLLLLYHNHQFLNLLFQQ